jgi:hypothetical protein
MPIDKPRQIYCPPKAGVTGSNPVGRAIPIKSSTCVRRVGAPRFRGNVGGNICSAHLGVANRSGSGS